MRRFACAILIVVTATATAMAGPDHLVGGAAAPLPAAAPSLTYAEAESVLAGLRAVSRHTVIIKDGAREETKDIPNKLGKGVREQIGLAIAALVLADRDFQAKNNALIGQYADGGSKVPDKAMAEFVAAQRKLMEQPSGASIPHFRIDDFQLDQNPDIDGEILAALAPVLDH